MNYFQLWFAMVLLAFFVLLTISQEGGGMDWGLTSCSGVRPPMRPRYMARERAYEPGDSSEMVEAEPLSEEKVDTQRRLTEEEKARILEDMRRFRRIRLKHAQAAAHCK